MNHGPLEVEGVHEENGWSGVGLRWTSGPIEVGTDLDPDDARDLVAECDDLGVSRSEIVEAILTAFVQSETNHVERVREIIIRKRKDTL
ncbi:hypothetical protein [Haloquadratum walsbyi]|uniref:Ribbon-helix-helix protein, copG family n=1 Tax=Haloquadratum walsbyi J07HQW2 TaxID=1238425 RepID=U1PRP3_9EURY|nr:hypothetical protein [Haloquadratum walsbyi]ERG96427.1 MAG: hypothetical protein J07HQW2_02906 [Haloquadratum walsbyi J07HQW2]